MLFMCPNWRNLKLLDTIKKLIRIRNSSESGSPLYYSIVSYIGFYTADDLRNGAVVGK